MKGCVVPPIIELCIISGRTMAAWLTLIRLYRLLVLITHLY